METMNGTVEEVVEDSLLARCHAYIAAAAQGTSRVAALAAAAAAETVALESAAEETPTVVDSDNPLHRDLREALLQVVDAHLGKINRSVAAQRIDEVKTLQRQVLSLEQQLQAMRDQRDVKIVEVERLKAEQLRYTDERKRVLREVHEMILEEYEDLE